MRLFKRERRKDHELRRLIDENKKHAKEVREITEDVIASINHDDDWLRKRLIKGKRSGSADCRILDDNCEPFPDI